MEQSVSLPPLLAAYGREHLLSGTDVDAAGAQRQSQGCVWYSKCARGERAYGAGQAAGEEPLGMTPGGSQRVVVPRSRCEYASAPNVGMLGKWGGGGGWRFTVYSASQRAGRRSYFYAPLLLNHGEDGGGCYTLNEIFKSTSLNSRSNFRNC